MEIFIVSNVTVSTFEINITRITSETCPEPCVFRYVTRRVCKLIMSKKPLSLSGLGSVIITIDAFEWWFLRLVNIIYVVPRTSSRLVNLCISKAYVKNFRKKISQKLYKVDRICYKDNLEV